MVYPNLIVAGPPKCGTSSLYQWLSDHPAACGSKPKETFYLMDPGHPLRHPEAGTKGSEWEAYEKFFAHCADAATLRFEATTHYIYQERARRTLSVLPRRPHVVFILRDPVQRVWSSFRYSQDNLANIHPGLSFSQYVDAVLEERFAEIEAHFRDSGSAYVLQRDVLYSQYVEYLLEWRRDLGSDRMMIALFERMIDDPRMFMKRIAQTTGLSAAFYDDYVFEAKNKSFGMRSSVAHRVARFLNTYLGAGRIKKTLRDVYLRLQKRRRVTTEADRAALRRLQEHFEPYNRQLAAEFDLNLSDWA